MICVTLNSMLTEEIAVPGDGWHHFLSFPPELCISYEGPQYWRYVSHLIQPTNMFVLCCWMLAPCRYAQWKPHLMFFNLRLYHIQHLFLVIQVKLICLHLRSFSV
jgi:hypothetical protein